MVIGLVCNAEGCPVGVEVFRCITKDETTVVEKIAQIRNDFGIEEIIFVGDRCMVTQANYDKVKDTKGLSAITALTHPQILKLIDEKHIEAELFDETRIVEVIDPADSQWWLCLCRNPESAARESRRGRTCLSKHAKPWTRSRWAPPA